MFDLFYQFLFANEIIELTVCHNSEQKIVEKYTDRVKYQPYKTGLEPKSSSGERFV